jgi:hypothetical protein
MRREWEGLDEKGTGMGSTRDVRSCSDGVYMIGKEYGPIFF